MSFYRYKLEEVLEMGFYEAHRLWGIMDELKARDLQFVSMANDFTNLKKEDRQDFIDWVQSRQPRRMPRQSVDSSIPKEVQDWLEKEWYG